jgi:hypothetical protein
MTDWPAIAVYSDPAYTLAATAEYTKATIELD